MIELGTKAKDRITGFEGTVTARAEYIIGCNQVLLQPSIDEKGEYRDSHWFDEQRVEDLGGPVVVLDNSRTPGPDRSAPKR